MAKNQKCSCCGNLKSTVTGYYISYSPICASNDKRMNICKECVIDIYERYVDFYGDEVKALYKTFESYNRPGLVAIYENYEIYALTWDDIFKSFDLRHSFMLDKLKFDRDELTKELPMKADRESADTLTKLVSSM